MAAICGMGTPGQNAQASTHLLKINISCPTPVISIQEKKKKGYSFFWSFPHCLKSSLLLSQSTLVLAMMQTPCALCGIIFNKID